MKSYDNIRSILDAALSEAVTAHERGLLNKRVTGDAVVKARERYDRFVLHGMIPDDVGDDDASPPSQSSSPV